MNFRDSIIRVFSTNILQVITSILIGFILPAILSIEDFANLKTYTFYLTYIGFLSFGFSDGMYIKYGGKKIENINCSELKTEHHIFLFIQSLITVFFLLLVILKKDFILLLMVISIIPINLEAFHKLFYQATGQFKAYTNASYIYILSYLFLNFFMIVILKSNNYIYYCLTNLVASIFIFIILEIKFYKYSRNAKFKYNSTVWNNMKVGFFVLLGNFSILLFYAIDRWFIKIFFLTEDFAFYSFAVSLLGIVNTLVHAISVIFYNYISKDENQEKLSKIKNYLIILGVIASSSYFILAGIVHLFLPKYLPALSIISISFVAYPYMIVINALYVNIYKARKEEKRYFAVVLKILLLSIIFNTVAIGIIKSPISIAVATTLVYIVWYIYSANKDFNYLKPSRKEKNFLIISFLVFIVLSHLPSWYYGGIMYVIIILILVSIFYKRELNELVTIILKFK
ncbi:capsular biosynthesis protein [Turicibacter sanguinis]|uniref:capsular biosynthesis protein n=1 Tax=Turicibacter sanguinis TaxID=154288 RepID=UPI0018A92025|nr:capsular biosynthesis protein [Turicibacter sanguinis]